jgi:hypothetical protein
MRDQIQARLNELRRQSEAGQAELQQVLLRENYLRETLLRISGAIQVLEELLAEQPTGHNETAPHHAEPFANQANEADAQ